MWAEDPPFVGCGYERNDREMTRKLASQFWYYCARDPIIPAAALCLRVVLLRPLHPDSASIWTLKKEKNYPELEKREKNTWDRRKEWQGGDKVKGRENVIESAGRRPITQLWQGLSLSLSLVRISTSSQLSSVPNWSLYVPRSRSLPSPRLNRWFVIPILETKQIGCTGKNRKIGKGSGEHGEVEREKLLQNTETTRRSKMEMPEIQVF